MSLKTVEHIINPPPTQFVGDGFRVHNFIPGEVMMQRLNPFVMFDYNSKHYFSPSPIPRGVGVHPHRGFETVTIAYKGKVQHNDSSGGGGIISEGDVQWMTAASGVLHKEFHETEWSKKGGDFQMVQLWVNLPAKYKMSAPKYQAIENKSIPKVFLDDGKSTIEVIAGNYNKITGAANTFTPIHLYNCKLAVQTDCTFSFPEHYNTAVLILEGKILINHKEIAIENQLMLMNNDGTDFKLTATQNATVLLLSAEPINEPIAAHGPFVMNTREEITQAFEDFRQGKFGVL